MVSASRQAASSPAKDGFVRLAMVLPFFEYLRENKAVTGKVLEAAGLDDARMRDPDALIHADGLYRLLDELALQSGISDLGLKVGESISVESWPPFVHAARDAATMGAFLIRFLSYIPQEASSVEHTLTIAADTACYRVRRLVSSAHLPIQAEAFGVGFFLKVLRVAAGSGWDPRRVRVETPYPQALPPRHLGVVIRWKDSDGLALHFPTEWLHMPVDFRFSKPPTPLVDDTADRTVLAALHGVLLPRLAERRPAAEDLADAMGMRRTDLEIALKKRHTTLAREIRKLKIREAKRALRNTKRPILEIAVELGYPDQSHFGRFFKSQTGQTPARFRKGV